MWCISVPAWCITCSTIPPTWNISRSFRRPISARSKRLPPPTRSRPLRHGNDVSLHRGYDGLGRRAELFDDLHLTRPVHGTVGTQNVVEPYGGRPQGIGPLPAVPGHVGLGLAVDEAPIDHAD